MSLPLLGVRRFSRLFPLLLLACEMQRLSECRGSPMEEAIWRGDLSKVKELQKKGQGINGMLGERREHPVFINYTALSLAIRTQHKAIAEYLIGQRVDVNMTNSDGSTALFSAVQKGDFGLDMVKLLLDHGANPNVKARDGTTALVWARLGQLTEITKLLLKSGANDPFAEAVIWVPQVQVETNGTKRLIHGIAYGNHTRNPLAAAAGDNDLVALNKALQRGIDINQGGTVADIFGCSALSIAVLRNHTNMVSYLVEHGANISKGNATGTTPLMLAVASPEGSKEMVELLLARGADVTLKDNQGNSALDYASLSANTNAVELLKRKTVSPDY